MDKHQWAEFLSQWSQAVLETVLAGALPGEIIASQWLGFPGATIGEIEVAEQRLGTQLPPSYRFFLEASNGWRMVRPHLTTFWPVEDIEWLRERRPELISSWRMGEAMLGGPEQIPDEEYFVYGEEQAPAFLRVEYLETALEISDLDPEMDAIYLLNPQVITPLGEWEAWVLAPYMPGAVRYRSFEEMMRAEYRNCLEDLAFETELPESTITRVGEIFRPSKEVESRLDLGELVAALEEAMEMHRKNADPKSASHKTLTGYHRAIVETLQEATTQVRELQDLKLDHHELVAKLGELAMKWERQGEEQMKDFMKNLDLRQVIRAGMEFQRKGSTAGLDEQYQGGGSPTGYITAASIIREHLQRS